MSEHAWKCLTCFTSFFHLFALSDLLLVVKYGKYRLELVSIILISIFFFTLMINHWFKKKEMKIKKERHEQKKKCSRVFNYLIGLHDFYVIELMKIMMKSRWCLKICYFFLLTNHFNSTNNFDLFLYKTYIDSEWLKKWIL